MTVSNNVWKFGERHVPGEIIVCRAFQNNEGIWLSASPHEKQIKIMIFTIMALTEPIIVSHYSCRLLTFDGELDFIFSDMIDS